MGQRPERLHVQLPPVRQAVEAARHEMAAAVFLEQAALAHFDAGVARHVCVSVFDHAITLRVLQLLVAVAPDAVELDHPVFESLVRGHLSGADFVGGRVPGDHGLGARAAGRSADAENVLQGGTVVFRRQGRVKAAAPREHLRGQCHQVVDLHLVCRSRFGADDRGEFQGTHATLAGVAEPFDGIER